MTAKRVGTKTELIGKLLLRPQGCTLSEVLNVTGWPTVSMPVQANLLGVKLRREKKPGAPMRYFAD